MKKLILLSTFFFSVSVHALPDCPSDTSVRWNNCFGTLTLPNGVKYVGEFKDDKYHGQGTRTLPIGIEYVGEFKDGEYHGQGTLTFPNVMFYVGEFKDGEYHGQGTRTFASGTIEVGYYMRGNYIPKICERMGLVKGTESFGNCVLKLIDDL